MKKLIFTILPSLLFILPNSISYFANFTNNQIGIVQKQLVKNPNKIAGKEAYDISDGNEVTPYLGYGNSDYKYWIYQTSLASNIFSYSKIEFAQYTDVWASWGNTSYKNRPYLINNISDNLRQKHPNFIENKKMENINDVNQNSVDWFHVKDYQGVAVVEIVVRFHFTWYYNALSMEFYFQIGIYMYGETWSSFSGGGIWANLGKQLLFSI